MPGAETPIAPPLEHVAEITVRTGSPVVIGQTQAGLRRIIPIAGGTIKGPHLNGVVLAAGADYQLVEPGGLATIDARYAVRLDDGVLLYVVDQGVRLPPPETMARSRRGEAVDPARAYFRSAIRFETGAEAYLFLTRRLHISTGTRHPDRIELDIFAVG